MLLRPALGVRETAAGRRLGALEGGGDCPLPMHPWAPSGVAWIKGGGVGKAGRKLLCGGG